VSDWSDEDAADLARLGPDLVKVLQKPFERHVLLESISSFFGTASQEAVKAMQSASADWPQSGETFWWVRSQGWH